MKTEKSIREMYDYNEVIVVSLFECWTGAYDATKMSDSQIADMLNCDDVEAYANENNIDRVDYKYAAGNNGSDSNYCIISEQDDRKSIVKDVNGAVLYQNGLKEYMNDFGEYWTMLQYFDGSNWNLSMLEA